MLDACGTTCPPACLTGTPSDSRRRSGPPGGSSGGPLTGLLSGFLPLTLAVVLAGLTVHLLRSLAAHLALADVGGALSVLFGMAAVLVVLLPLTFLCARAALIRTAN